MIRKRLLILGVLMCVVGLVGAIASQLQKPKFVVDEKWMQDKAPTQIDGMDSIENAPPDKATYEALQPFGIVGRTFRGSHAGYDVLLIASDRRESFHSPNVCMPAQGLGITNEHIETIQTQSHGPVKLIVSELQLPNEPAKQYMAYLYKVQDKFIARSGNSTLALTWAMFQGPIRGNFDQNTVFYRFITENEHASKDGLLNFVSHYLDAAHDSSGGYF